MVFDSALGNVTGVFVRFLQFNAPDGQSLHAARRGPARYDSDGNVVSTETFTCQSSAEQEYYPSRNLCDTSLECDQTGKQILDLNENDENSATPRRDAQRRDDSL